VDRVLPRRPRPAATCARSTPAFARSDRALDRHQRSDVRDVDRFVAALERQRGDVDAVRGRDKCGASPGIANTDLGGTPFAVDDPFAIVYAK
jgi:hypothetical protein